MTRTSPESLARVRALFGEYPDRHELVARVRRAAVDACGVETVVGRSVEDRPIECFSFGRRSGRRVLLSSLVHGTELVGAVALAHAVDLIVARRLHLVHAFTVVPVVNPDALDRNLDALRAGRLASLRGNASGVDLNRNFPLSGAVTSRHPMAGSTNPRSPYFMGRHPLSEPESRALSDVAEEVAPELSLSFHSFGERLLYPFAHTSAPHPRRRDYEALGRAWNASLSSPYRVQSSASWYPVNGDFDDYLDARFGTLAMTVEVGNLDRRLLHPSRLINPFSWMNPLDATREASRVADGVVSMLRALSPREADVSLLAAE